MTEEQEKEYYKKQMDYLKELILKNKQLDAIIEKEKLKEEFKKLDKKKKK